MEKMKKVSLRIIILLAALLCMTAFLTGCGETQPSAVITILHTNDTHGRVLGDEEHIIGIDRIAAIYKNTPNSILVDAGDTFHGLPIATLSKGVNIAELMNEAGYDAMVVGNHEFNYGWEHLIELRKIADFPFLASNITSDSSEFLDDTAIIEIDGVKIGLFGVSTEATKHSAMPEYVRGLEFNDPIQTAREKSEYLRGQGVHIIAALCHLGVEPYNGTLSAELAKAVPEIDVIIDGHSHTGLAQGIIESGVLIAQAGNHGNNIGKIVFTIENGEIISKTASLISFEEAQNTEPDEATQEKLHEIMSGIETMLNEPVGESTVSMSSERSPGVRTQEMPLGSLVADAYRFAANAEIAIANGGDIRADIISGTITKGDIISVLPFGNTLMVKNITPALLREVLENGVSGIVTDTDGNIDHENSPQGRFLHVSGFSFVYAPTAPEGERIVSITIDGGKQLALDDNTTILTLAGSSYVMTGGDYYTMLGALPILHELGTADEALGEYITTNSPINAPSAGRITS
ncbi:MAG: bifunctional metallophosphatase/5'-nucleotidase [Oscillospiraceae bacterium]|nr:bifunctional metallophosphatase/5'-nucleotidase [Oscillospiraceae bacterium]